jgi:hypothetical protein
VPFQSLTAHNPLEGEMVGKHLVGRSLAQRKLKFKTIVHLKKVNRPKPWRKYMNNFQDKLVKRNADESCERICQKVIKALQGMKEANLSGDDSGLENSWDEICVQVQGEESFSSDAYQDTALQFIHAEVKLIPSMDAQAIWLQTDNGFDWANDVDESNNTDGDSAANKTDNTLPPANDDDIENYILKEFVLREAGNWSNSKIRKYLDTH